MSPTTQWGLLLDLDQTIVLTEAIEPLRKRRSWTQVYKSFDKTVLPLGTREFVNKAMSIMKVGIVTTSPRPYAERLLAYHQLSVRVLVAYHDVARRKPHPEPILKAATMLGINPRRCFHLGDQALDVEAATKAGAIPILISWDSDNGRSHINKNQAFCRNWEEVYEVILSHILQSEVDR